MVRVLQRMVTLETETALAAWMARVVETTALDLLRAESRRVRREQTVARDRPEQSHGLDPLLALSNEPGGIIKMSGHTIVALHSTGIEQ